MQWLTTSGWWCVHRDYPCAFRGTALIRYFIIITCGNWERFVGIASATRSRWKRNAMSRGAEAAGFIIPMLRGGGGEVTFLNRGRLPGSGLLTPIFGMSHLLCTTSSNTMSHTIYICVAPLICCVFLFGSWPSHIAFAFYWWCSVEGAIPLLAGVFNHQHAVTPKVDSSLCMTKNHLFQPILMVFLCLSRLFAPHHWNQTQGCSNGTSHKRYDEDAFPYSGGLWLHIAHTILAYACAMHFLCQWPFLHNGFQDSDG